MATIVNPVGAFDFAHSNDFSSSSYPFDPLNPFPDNFTAKTAMSEIDPSFLHNYLSGDVEDQSDSTQHTSSQPPSSSTKQTAYLHSTPVTNQYPLGPASSTISTSSESNSHTIQSANPSSVSSPEMHYPFGQLPEFSNTSNTGYMGSAEHSTFGAEPYGTEFTDYAAILAGENKSGFVDPSLLQQGVLTPTSLPTPTHQVPQAPPPTSPALSQASSHMSRAGSNRFKSQSSRSQSPYLQSHQWTPYTKRPFPPTVPRSPSGEVEDSEREKNRCPHPECGKIFKDLKAHMLTHQNERPEKCPIPSCEYSKKGFSRKYDKNRHTLTHYKGTMVCGFCPGSGSSAEKSFNRADVFKRHLTTVHGVEQNPPNSRKKPSAAAQARSTQNFGDATGKCSICSGVFSNAQDFYEHLEDCVLNVVQKTDPSEAINEQLLTSVADDQNVKESLERNNLPTALDNAATTYGSAEDEEEDDSEDNDGGKASRRIGQVGASHVNEGGAISKPGAPSRGPSGGRGPRGPGLTYSKGGVPLSRSGRKRRKNYPNSWGSSADKMKMKKRVLTVWDGQRRLGKDDMMLSNDFEVRIPLPDAGDGAYVTDLDVQTLQRAEGFFAATEEEKGPWEQFVTNVPDGNMGGLVP